MKTRIETKNGIPSRTAFTLIEVLAAMAVLVILVLALTRMFGEAASITRKGSTALVRNSAGETALETLLQDTEGMAVNERLGCYVEADVLDKGGFGFDDVWFITTSGEVYAYRDGELTPSTATEDPNAYAELARGMFATA